MATIVMKHVKKEWPQKVSEVLTVRHLADLRESGLDDETILEARIYSVLANESRIMLERRQDVGPGFVIPYPAQKGFTASFNFKPDKPMPDLNGKSRKYLRAIGSKQRLYIPVPAWRIINSIEVPLIFTEGEKKALKATQEGFNTIAMSGVYGWLSNHEPINDFKFIKLLNRVVYIAFDSDKYTNHKVLEAEQRFADFLKNQGAKVRIIDFNGGDQ